MYKVTDIVLLGFRSLTTHKVRSLLAILSILFGVWSVIAMLAINEGARYEAEQSLRQMGTDKFLIQSLKPPQDRGAAQQTGRALYYGLTRADHRRLSESLPGLLGEVAGHETRKFAQYGTRLVPVRVFGTDPSYLQLRGLRVAAGRFLSAADELRCRNVCVMTQSLARRLFGYEDPLISVVRLGGESFDVVGLVDTPGGSTPEVPADLVSNLVYVPASTERTRFGEYSILRTTGSFEAERVEVSQIIFHMADERAVLAGAKIAESILQREHESPDYEINVPLDKILQLQRQRRLWNIMFFAIASISLLVGAIGIANIMLASVTERTREIGIRRALGAKRRDITVQFLVEAVTLTTGGGLMGIVLGFVVPPIVQAVLKVTAILSPPMLMVPFLMAVAVGLVSGLYPAMRAARLDPITALRHE
ncbi:MAG: hypothetical protein AMJ81_03855 [Phycisphaerae bacterium SM23_33]|nr:MAG: hypothetical protein AMJ81_03855 [Phycisphaerae bacterium SM23_33]